MSKRFFLVTFDAALEPHEVRQVTAGGIRRALWREVVPHAPEACVRVQEVENFGGAITVRSKEANRV